MVNVMRHAGLQADATRLFVEFGYRTIIYPHWLRVKETGTVSCLTGCGSLRFTDSAPILFHIEALSVPLILCIKLIVFTRSRTFCISISRVFSQFRQSLSILAWMAQPIATHRLAVALFCAHLTISVKPIMAGPALAEFHQRLCAIARWAILHRYTPATWLAKR
jgi:hypothetical protein